MSPRFHTLLGIDVTATQIHQQSLVTYHQPPELDVFPRRPPPADFDRPRP